MNMGQEYIDGKPKYDRWRDTHLRIEGDAVHVLNALFVRSWKEVRKESLFDKKYFTHKKKISNHLPIQIISSGPDSEEEYLRQMCLEMIRSAKHHVYIQSPYFIPDPTIHEALKLSAMSGVDTRFMMTGVPDKKTAFWAAFSFFQSLLYSGVKIYHYKPGFLHSKAIAVDSKYCTLGTTNIDTRSFKTSHEVNAVIYDHATTKKIEKYFMQDLEDCERFTLKDYQKLKAPIRLRNSLARLLTPLL
jgi:cardiolipin synthase